MPKSMRVRTRFSADDDISKVARRIEKNVERMNRRMQKGFKRSSRSAKGFQSVFKGILAAGAVGRGLDLLKQGITKTVTEFASFDDAITAAAVRFKDIGPDAKNFTERLNIIKKAAREAGQTTLKTATESAAALDFLARAGFTSVEAMGSLRSMINLSIATGEDFAQVADFSSDLLGAFGLAVDDSAQKIKNLNRLNDVLVKTTNSANVTVEDLFETMKTIGPIASGILEISLEDVAAQTAILGNSGIKGTIAMTALKNAYLNLASPAGEGAKILKIFNLSLKDGKGGVRSLTDVLKELDEKMQLKGVDPVDQAKILDAIFGKRAIAGAKNLMDNIRNVEQFKSTLLDAGGTAQKTADIMAKSLGNEVRALGSAFLEFGFKFMDPWEKDMKKSIKSVTESMRDLDPTWLSGKFKNTLGDMTQFIEDVLNFPFKIREKIRAFLGIGGEGELAGDRGGPVFGQDGESEFRNARGQRITGRQFHALQLRKEMAEIADGTRPTFNIDVNQNISSENINVDTTIKAPGGSGKVQTNNF
jgi:TP901 family phage tail tape measure protein